MYTWADDSNCPQVHLPSTETYLVSSYGSFSCLTLAKTHQEFFAWTKKLAGFMVTPIQQGLHPSSSKRETLKFWE